MKLRLVHSIHVYCDREVAAAQEQEHFTFRYWWNPETNARYYTRDDLPHGWGFFRKDGVERFINVANGEQSTEHPSESKRVVVSVGGGGGGGSSSSSSISSSSSSNSSNRLTNNVHGAAANRNAQQNAAGTVVKGNVEMQGVDDGRKVMGKPANSMGAPLLQRQQCGMLMAMMVLALLSRHCPRLRPIFPGGSPCARVYAWLVLLATPAGCESNHRGRDKMHC